MNDGNSLLDRMACFFFTISCAYFVQLYPSTIQDLSRGSPIIISGRYEGKLPESLTVRGTLADMSNFVTDLKIRKEKDIPLHKVISFLLNSQAKRSLVSFSHSCCLSQSVPFW